MLAAEVQGARVLAASYDREETERRKAAARVRLHRLFGRGDS